MCLAEADAKYGADKIKVYRSTFTPMYYAMTETKVKCSMKLICLLPEEKVILAMNDIGSLLALIALIEDFGKSVFHKKVINHNQFQ